MYCTKCGAQLPEGSRFCNQCGSVVTPVVNDQTDQNDPFAPVTPAKPEMPQQQIHQQAPGARRVDDGIFGLLGFILSFFVAIAGLVLSIIGLTKTKNRGFAIAGLVISIVSMVLTAIWSAYIVAALPFLEYLYFA